jgi:hypothetical protein
VVSMYFPRKADQFLVSCRLLRFLCRNLAAQPGAHCLLWSRCKNRCFGASFADTRMARAVASSCG